MKEIQYKSIIENLPLTLVLIDKDKKICSHNKTDFTENIIGKKYIGNLCKLVNCRNGSLKASEIKISMLCDNCKLKKTVNQTFENRRKIREQNIIIEENDKSQPEYYSLETNYLEIADEPNVLICLEKVTARIHAETALKNSEEKFRSLFEKAGDAIFIMDETFTFIECNDRAYDLTGWKKNEIIGQTPMLFSPEYQPGQKRSEDLIQEHTKNLLKGKSDQFEWTAFTKDGKTLYLDISIFFHFSDHIRLMYAVVKDQTKRKMLEVKNIENRNRITRLNSAITDLLNRKELKEAYIYIADSIQKLYPDTLIALYSVADDSNHVILETVSGLDTSLLAKVLKYFGFNPIGSTYSNTEKHKQIFNTGKFLEYTAGFADFISDDIGYKTASSLQKIFGIKKIYTIGIKSGNKHLASVLVMAFKDEIEFDKEYIELYVKNAGTVLQEMISKNRIKINEEKLENLVAAKNKFFSIIAHDLRSPFNAIIGFSKILLENYGKYSPEKQQEFIKLIKESSEKTYDLLENLLDWSGAQTGKLKFIPEYHDLKGVFENVISENKSSADKKSISIEYAAGKIKNIRADKFLLQTVLRNLISNAIKFSYPNSVITLTAKISGTDVLISVNDNGKGIEEDMIDKLFDIGEKTVTLGTAEESGSGLGLHLCKEFIEKHGGRIWVKSTKGKGSTFYFTIPQKNNM